MTRDKFTVKFSKPVVSNKGGLQLATPEIVAKYIAMRLKTGIIADLGCGIGGQVIHFAQECKKVYAVERDHEKIEFARKNCELYGVNNVEFIEGDALSESVIKKVSDAEIIFSDPARPLSEKERTLDNLEPPITDIIRLYSTITSQLAFHVPPQMPPSRLTMDCEREYLSLSGQLNRLTIYFGSLKKSERSAVILPGQFRLSFSDAPEIKKSSAREYVYEPEPSVVKSELINELGDVLLEQGDEIYLYRKDARRTLLTSDKCIDSPFFKDRYHVLGITEREGSKMKGLLKAKNAKDVVLRFDIEPEMYWKFRKELESGLNGSKTLHVFGFGNEVAVCEKIKKWAR